MNNFLFGLTASLAIFGVPYLALAALTIWFAKVYVAQAQIIEQNLEAVREERPRYVLGRSEPVGTSIVTVYRAKAGA